MTFLQQIGALVLIVWLPGAVLFHAPFLDRDRRASLDAEERWFWQIILSVAISLSGAMLLAGFGLYTFDRLLAANLLIAVGIAGAGRFRLRMGNSSKRVGTGAILPLVLILLGAWRFFPPAEYVLGGKDPGTYMNEGIQIAQRGGLVIRDTTVASVPPR